MSYSINSFPATPPPGSIMPYLGTSDPDGWVICNGIARTNGNGKYKNVYTILNTALGVTTNTENSITPPDLTNRMIYGRNNTSDTSVKGGNSAVTLGATNMPAHNHSVSVSSHAHTYQDVVYTENGGSGFNDKYGIRGGDWDNGFSWRKTDGGVSNTPQDLITGATQPNASCGNAYGGTGGAADAFSIMNPYMTMNYIMKI